MVATCQEHKRLGFIESYREYYIHLSSLLIQPVHMSGLLQVHVLISAISLQPHGNSYLSLALAEGLLKVRWIVGTKFLLKFLPC